MKDETFAPFRPAARRIVEKGEIKGHAAHKRRWARQLFHKLKVYKGN